MKLLPKIILCVLLYSKVLSGAITGFQIGIHNLIDSRWVYSSNQINRSGMMIGFIFPANRSDSYDLNFRMKLTTHTFKPHSYYQYLLVGSNEFLLGKRMQVYSMTVLPQAGFGFVIDYINSIGNIHGNFFYDISINFLSVFNREALGLSLNFEQTLSGISNERYPNRRLSITTLFFY